MALDQTPHLIRTGKLEMSVTYCLTVLGTGQQTRRSSAITTIPLNLTSLWFGKLVNARRTTVSCIAPFSCNHF